VQGGEKNNDERQDWSPPGASALAVTYAKNAAASIRSGVEIAFFGSGASPAASLDALQISQMLRDAGPLITLKVFDAEGDKEECSKAAVLFFPTMNITGHNRGSVRFLGVPAGWGLRILAEALVIASTGEAGLGPKTVDKLASLRKPVVIKVFISPESEYCRRAAVLAVRMAVESRHVSAELINSTDFPVLSRRYGVETTPKTIINDTIEVLGARSETDLVERVLAATVPQARMYH
jgi:hypothetical protein